MIYFAFVWCVCDYSQFFVNDSLDVIQIYSKHITAVPVLNYIEPSYVRYLWSIITFGVVNIF